MRESLSDYEGYIREMSQIFTAKFPSIREDVEQEMRIAWYSLQNEPEHPEWYVKCHMKGRAIDFLRHYRHRHFWETLGLKEISYEWLVEKGMAQAVGFGEDEIVDRITASQIIDSIQNERSRTIIKDYFSGVKLKELGRRFGVNDTRICQIKSEILEKLRRKFPEAA